MRDTTDALRAAEEFFHAQIPVTRAMGLRVVPDEEHGFAIAAPVALNYNHLHTAFGGSINAVATLAGYAWLWLELRGEPVHLVVRESSIRFLQPVRETIRAVCSAPAAEEVKAFRAALGAKGKARLTLEVRVAEESGVPAAQFTGTFVALPGRGPAGVGAIRNRQV